MASLTLFVHPNGSQSDCSKCKSDPFTHLHRAIESLSITIQIKPTLLPHLPCYFYFSTAPSGILCPILNGNMSVSLEAKLSPFPHYSLHGSPCYHFRAGYFSPFKSHLNSSEEESSLIVSFLLSHYRIALFGFPCWTY